MLIREVSMLTHLAMIVTMVNIIFHRENRTDRNRRRYAKMEQLCLKMNGENSTINIKNRQRYLMCNDIATMISNSFPVRVRQWAVTRPTESFLLKIQTENTTLRIRLSRARAFYAFYFCTRRCTYRRKLIGNKPRQALGDRLCLYESFPVIWRANLAFWLGKTMESFMFRLLHSSLHLFLHNRSTPPL